MYFNVCLKFLISDLHVPGRGVITTTARESGKFLLVYWGEVLSKEEGERREENDGGTGYRFFYKATGKQLW